MALGLSCHGIIQEVIDYCVQTPLVKRDDVSVFFLNYDESKKNYPVMLPLVSSDGVVLRVGVTLVD